jgi:MFS family permease
VKPSTYDDPPKLQGHYLRQWLGLTLALLALCYLLNMVMGIPRAGLPRVLRDYVGASAAMTALADLLFFGIGKCLTDLLAGWMTDAFRGGRKTVLLIGGSLTCAGCVCIWLAIPAGVEAGALAKMADAPRPAVEWSAFLMISLGQFLNGLGSGFQNQGIMTAMQDLGGRLRRGLAGGIMEAALYYGVTTGNYLGGKLVEITGQVLFPFLFMAVLAAVCTVAAGVWTVDTRQAILVPAGFRLQRPTREAYRQALTHRSLWVIYFAGLMSKWVDSLIFVTSSLYLKSLGYSIPETAIIQTCFVLSWATVSMFTGALSDRIGRKHLIWLGMLWNGVFTLVFLYLSRPGSKEWEMFLMILLGCGTGFYYGLPPAIAADVAAVEWRGVAISVYRFWRDFGHIASTLVFFAIYWIFGETLLGVAWIFWVSAVLLIAGAAVAAIFMQETHPGMGKGS